VRLNSLIILLVGLCHWALSQEKASTLSYMLPVRPGEVNFLSGTMGELRSNHFHAGIDIKTSGIQGLSVYAAEEGYISRIKISIGGYGNTLYMTHKDGSSTVYAHLREFQKELGDYVREAQYQNQSFVIELFPHKDEFRFDKGAVIAYSGNSGSSSGPHLHFEIRDEKQHLLNPLEFRFPEIKDQIPPVVKQIALVTLDINSRINGKFGRFEFNVQRVGTHFYIDQPIEVFGRVGVELLAHDKLDGAPNKNGIPFVDVELDKKRTFYQGISSFSFSDSRNIFVHTNYPVSTLTRKRFAKLYIDDGNELKFYKSDLNRGISKINIHLMVELVRNV